ncbi:MAG: S8 family serine peptidase [Candidatus Cybelea sp.]
MAVVMLAGCGGSQPPFSTPGAQGHIPYWQATHSARAACSGSRIGQVQCDVLIENKAATPNYVGVSAAEIEAAYKLPYKTNGKGQNVYIVDAFDNPDVVSNFATYRSGMGLPKGTINKYNQEGQKSNYPTGNSGWGVEIDLDVEMVSASCPLCTVNLIEANSNNNTDLEAAEAEAVKLGATIVSNSYDGSGLTESYFDTKGVSYLASSGDNGYGLYQPASFKDVFAVGGTSLSVNTGEKRGYGELVWVDTGGGCSDTDEAKPSWQKDPDCSYRTGSDIGAVAVDAAEYDTYGASGWIQVDGTSISSPLVAGIIGEAGNSTKQVGGEHLWGLSKKQQRKQIYKITIGNDGSCGGEYLCTAGTKQFGIFSGPTGWGTPHGIKAL